ncbi:MAG: ATP-binding protein, partial [Bacteroidetes bacterium]|nr:ATP-binding protein [Bacteroidota bacterium]
MNQSRIQSILNEGEGLKIEFKQCRTAINRDVYDTVCSFLNRQGGELLLGVKDNGEVLGIAPE